MTTTTHSHKAWTNKGGHVKPAQGSAGDGMTGPIKGQRFCE